MPMTAESLLLFSIFFIPDYARGKVFQDHLSAYGVYDVFGDVDC